MPFFLIIAEHTQNRSESPSRGVMKDEEVEWEDKWSIFYFILFHIRYMMLMMMIVIVMPSRSLILWRGSLCFTFTFTQPSVGQQLIERVEMIYRETIKFMFINVMNIWWRWWYEGGDFFRLDCIHRWMTTQAIPHFVTIFFWIYISISKLFESDKVWQIEKGLRDDEGGSIVRIFKHLKEKKKSANNSNWHSFFQFCYFSFSYFPLQRKLILIILKDYFTRNLFAADKHSLSLSRAHWEQWVLKWFKLKLFVHLQFPTRREKLSTWNTLFASRRWQFNYLEISSL